MRSALYYEWEDAWNKDELRFYDRDEFRRDYTELEMDGKANMFKRLALGDVQEVLASIRQQDSRRSEIHILSLGCGPGSDLLGILRAVESSVRPGAGLGWRAGQLRCVCTGVDAFPWNRNVFRHQLNGGLITDGMLGRISYTFVEDDMQEFVQLHCNSYNFDFICMSFADAGRNQEMVGDALPSLVSRFGRVLVLDNDIPPVRNLQSQYGYMCTSSSYGICMHSRGRGKVNRSYRPSENSPIKEYRLRKVVELLRIWYERSCIMS